MRITMIFLVFHSICANAQECVREEDLRLGEAIHRVVKTFPECADTSTYWHQEFSGTRLIREGQVVDRERHAEWHDLIFGQLMEFDKGRQITIRGYAPEEMTDVTERINDSLAVYTSFYANGDTAEHGSIRLEHPSFLQGRYSGEWIEYDRERRYKTIRYFEPYADDKLGFWVYGIRETQPARRIDLETGAIEVIIEEDER